jgi:type II secretory pathway pseudopilin PulG
VFEVSHKRRAQKAGIIPIMRSMRKKFAILFATALVSVSGAMACSGLQEDLQKRAQEEVEKGRKQVEQKVQDERKKAEKKVQEKVQEGQQRIEEGVKKGQQQAKEKAQ